jgi:hypothetical protein
LGSGIKHYRSLSCPISAAVVVAAQCAEALGTAGPAMGWIPILQPSEPPRRVVYRAAEEYGMFVVQHHHPSRIHASRSKPGDRSRGPRYTGTVASGAGIKAGEAGEALHREPPNSSDGPAVSGRTL